MSVRMVAISAVVLVGLVTSAVAAQRPAGAAAPAVATAVDRDGTTPLHKAVLAGDLADVKRLLADGADVRARTRYGVAPIAMAVTRGNSAIVSALLNAGADPNTAMGAGETALMTAARVGDVTSVQLLLDRGADINARERVYGETAMMFAAIENHAGVIDVLADHKGDVNARSTVLEGPPTWREGKDARTGLNGEALQAMLSTFPRGGLTPLLFAARQGSVDAIRALVRKGADVGLTDPEGYSPLLIAIWNLHYTAAAALVEMGADVNQASRTGQTPLLGVADSRTLLHEFGPVGPRPTDSMDALDLARLLLARKADPNRRLTGPSRRPGLPGYGIVASGNPNITTGATALMRAAVAFDVPMMRVLLTGGADPTITNQNGANALHVAAGLRLSEQSIKPATTLGFGSEDDSVEAIKLLLDAGMDVNAADKLGNTAVGAAAARNARKVVEFLVARGARVDSKPKAAELPDQ